MMVQCDSKRVMPLLGVGEVLISLSVEPVGG